MRSEQKPVRDTSFAFADAQIRAMESQLLTQTHMQQLISAPDVRSATDLLTGWGVITGEKGISAQAQLQQSLCRTWESVHALVPDQPAMTLPLIKNDCHNLKTALKALVCDRDPEPFFLYPSTVDPAALYQCIKEKRFDQIPASKVFAGFAEEAYELVTRVMDAQLLDCQIDRYALEQILKAGKESGSELIFRYACFMADTALIKIAYRAARAKKSKQFITDALIDTPNLSAALLGSAAAKGCEELLNSLGATPYAQGAALLRTAPAAFEKWCDDEAMEILSEARQISFGIEPLLAYYTARETELNNVRMILACKASGADEQTVTERMRQLYV